MRGHIKGLNGLRAIAVLMVVATHKTGIGDTLALGGFGVRMFFALSGFLIIGILADRRRAIAAGTADFRTELLRFYENRLYRIWPIYFLSVALLIGLGAAGVWPMPGGEQIAAMLSFTMNLFLAHRWTGYPDTGGHLWSIAVEEQFYLWAALAFLLAPVRQYGRICIVVIAIGLASLAAGALFGWPVRHQYTGSLPNFAIMAAGGLMATAIAPRGWMVRAAPVALALFLALPLLCWALDRTSVAGLVAAWLAVPAVAILLPGIAHGQAAPLVRVLEWRPIEYVGRISYGLYLYHPFVEIGHGRAAGLLEIGAAIAVAAASWHWLERPLLRVRDRRRQRRMGLVPPAPIHDPGPVRLSVPGGPA